MWNRRSPSYSPFDLAQFSTKPPTKIDLPVGKYLLEFETVASTQDVARAIVSSGEANCLGIRADFQSRGRGRSERDWFAPAGECLLATYIFDWTANPANAGILALAAGVGVSDAIERLTGLSAQLKWP